MILVTGSFVAKDGALAESLANGTPEMAVFEAERVR